MLYYKKNEFATFLFGHIGTWFEATRPEENYKEGSVKPIYFY